MILLWGIAADDPLAQVHAALLHANSSVAFLDQQSALQSTIDLKVDRGVRGRLETPDWSVELESVSAIYLRPYDARRIPALQRLSIRSRLLQQACEFERALTCWVEMTPALVVSPPSAMASNHSKPHQLQLIRAVGFDVPETLVTTDPAAALEFWERHREVIYKSVSGIRSIVTKLTSEHRERLRDVTTCPTQFQQYISGVDYRVHVVGAQIFCCEIHSDAHDYRYAQRQGANVRFQACTIPAAVGERCRQLALSLDLPVAGIDLRRTATERWYCFEVNPSPGFTYYEAATGHPISAAVAALLRAGRESIRCL